VKIGILTLPFNNNYGGLLQAYALQKYFRERGHEVYSIQQPAFGKEYEVKQIIKRSLGVGEIYDANNLRNFQHGFRHETFPVKVNKDLYRLKTYEFDAIVVGSDQVWRFNYSKENYKRYFLNFVQNINVLKVAYSASFGVDLWEATGEQTDIVRNLITNFDFISVRENSGIVLCRKYLNYDRAVQLHDPTLLLKPADYRTLYSGFEKDKKGLIGTYILDPDVHKTKLIDYLKDQLSKDTFSIGKQIKTYKRKTINYFEPINEWIHSFETSDYILTDSYHGMIFSILFNKPFLVIGNKIRGLGRFVSLLSMLHMQERLIEIDDIKKNKLKLMYPDNNYNAIEKLFNDNRERSDNYLKNIGL
jgi:hypothetical protein